MAQVQLHYDGWLALPAVVRERLGVATGDRLEVELAGDTAVLRRTHRAGAAGRAATEAAAAGERRPEDEPAEPAPVAAPAVPVKRGPGRPRKVSTGAALPPGREARGRREGLPVLEAQPQ
jgi:bifunctional DNA-binding transcriptional regulator/antitoxin component of YhaV-PrlF toxin-antitoxin module